MIDDDTKQRLARVHDEARLTEAEGRMKNGWYASGPYVCLSTGCGKRILKPRLLKSEYGGRYVTLSFCSQECHDAWFRSLQRGVRPVRYEWYAADGQTLLGYYLPGTSRNPGRYITLEEIDAAEQVSA